MAIGASGGNFREAFPGERHKRRHCHHEDQYDDRHADEMATTITIITATRAITSMTMTVITDTAGTARGTATGKSPAKPTNRSRDDRLRSDELPGGVAFVVFEGVYEGFKLFISHTNASSGRAPAIHGLRNIAQYLPGSRVRDAKISNYRHESIDCHVRAGILGYPRLQFAHALG